VLNSEVRDPDHPRRDAPSQATSWVAGCRARWAASGNKMLRAVVLDGAFVYLGNPGEQPFNINTLQPDAIAGLEFYASAASMP